MKFYERLGVSREASADEIKRAFKKAALVNHPDKGGDPEAFKEINEAYSVLSDESKRQRYDQVGDAGWAAGAGDGPGGPGPGFPGGAADFFSGIFGSAFGAQWPPQPGPLKRPDCRISLAIRMAEAYTGQKKMIRLSVSRHCSKCRETCKACQGRGRITNMSRHPLGLGMMISETECGACQAVGVIIAGKPGCSECSGKGTYAEERKIEIAIPAGVRNGHTIVVAGCGEQPLRDGELPGDLVFAIAVPDVCKETGLRREGDHLAIEIPLTFEESVLGKRIEIPHVSGTPVVIDTNAQFGVVCGGGQKYVIAGKGMRPQASDLILSFAVAYPRQPWKPEAAAAFRQAFAVA